jgi:fructosamine-3-kinase
MSKAERESIDFQTGKINTEINSIQNDKFGYFSQKEKQGKDWFTVFYSLMQDVISDSLIFNTDIAISKKYVFDLLVNFKPYFDEVKTPKLVHWDIWLGNIFVKDNKVTGIIDFERCLWADYLMEVGFRTYNYDSKPFFEGYKKQPLSQSEFIRAKFYDLYVFLISSLEYDFRHYANREYYYWAVDSIKRWQKDIIKFTNM